MPTACGARESYAKCQRQAGHDGRHEKLVGGNIVVRGCCSLKGGKRTDATCPRCGTTGYDVFYWPTGNGEPADIEAASPEVVARSLAVAATSG